MSNKFFHEGKDGTEELEAQSYIEDVSKLVGLEAD